MAISGPTSAIKFLVEFLNKLRSLFSDSSLRENVTLIIFTYLKSWTNDSSLIAVGLIPHERIVETRLLFNYCTTTSL